MDTVAQRKAFISAGHGIPKAVDPRYIVSYGRPLEPGGRTAFLLKSLPNQSVPLKTSPNIAIGFI